MSEVVLELKEIEKSFEGTEVLRGISLRIQKGEFITFLGASGCGKTTTLRIISGLESPEKGKVILNGQDVTNLEPNKRNVNTVFQNYALFPHMNVFENVAYSMKIRKVKKEEIKKTVTEMLKLVQLEGFEKRMSSMMSGGQKQRVAIARALANKPEILLLDEPLGALDLQLRRQMQTELKRLQKKLGITFIYITHDQEEAINMSDRIVVMKDGRLEQVGTPEEVYNHPKTSYVAQFVGNANIIKGELQEIDGKRYIKIGTELVPIKAEKFSIKEEVTIAVRSENIELSKEKKEEALLGRVEEKTFTGGMLRMIIRLENGQELTASRHGIDADFIQNDKVFCYWKKEHAAIVDREENR